MVTFILTHYIGTSSVREASYKEVVTRGGFRLASPNAIFISNIEGLILVFDIVEELSL